MTNNNNYIKIKKINNNNNNYNKPLSQVCSRIVKKVF